LRKSGRRTRLAFSFQVKSLSHLGGVEPATWMRGSGAATFLGVPLEAGESWRNPRTWRSAPQRGGILELTMPVPTPGREGEAPSLVLQELSTQSDLSASAGLPSAGEAQFPTVRGGANRFAGGHMDAERGAGLVGLPAERIRYCYWVRLGFARGSRCSPSGRWAGWRRSPSAAECIVWHIMTLAIVLGTISAFDMPGRQSLIVRMTSTEDLLHAISMNSAIFNGARVVGGFQIRPRAPRRAHTAGRAGRDGRDGIGSGGRHAGVRRQFSACSHGRRFSTYRWRRCRRSDIA